MQHYGLIGFPLEHSFSASYFKTKFSQLNIEADYKNFAIETLDDLKYLIEKNQLVGLNVTIPFKEKIIPYLDQIDSTAQQLGAVNCIKISNGKLIGFNTDIIGFEQSLVTFLKPVAKKALVFGTGGSSKAVAFVLQKLSIPFQFVSRQKAKNSLTYNELSEAHFKEFQLLINTTPVGMFPHNDDYLPLPYHFISKKQEAFDLIYNPSKTKFLELCEQHGARIQNGYDMLVIQAEASYKIFTSLA